MSDFSVRSDNVDVEQIMRQIRARIREKRGVDYTEEEVRELAKVKLEKFIDPKGVRSDLIEQYRNAREMTLPPNYKFEDTTLFETHRSLLAFIRRLLRPVLKLFFNPNPLIDALHIQSQLNAERAAMEPLQYELMHNLVIELTRTTIEVKNLKMRLESMSSRLDFDERRARALEGVVQYRPGAVPPLQPPTGQRDQRDQRDQREQRDQRDQREPRRDQAPRPQPQGGQPQGLQGQSGNALDNEGNERRSRRRRRRGRRRGGDGRGPAVPGAESAAHASDDSAGRPSDIDHRGPDAGHGSSGDDGGSGGSSAPPTDAPSE
jgi:hypothetical protein